MYLLGQIKHLDKKSHQSDKRALPFAVRFTFLVFVFTLPFEGLDTFITLPAFSLAKVSGYVFLASLFLCPKILVTRPPAALPIKWFLAYFIIYAFGIVAVDETDLRPTILGLFRMLQLLVFFFAASKILTDARLSKAALWSFCSSCALLAVIAVGLPGFAVQGIASTGRQSALDYGESFVGYLMALCLLAMSGLWISGRSQGRWRRLVLSVLALPCIVLLFNTGSRAAVGALALGFLVFVVLEKDFRKHGAALLLGLLALFILKGLGESVAVQRWSKTFDEGNLGGREHMYPAALEMIHERPMFGWIRYEEELADRTGGRFYGTVRNAHSLPLHLLLQVGIVGAIPFFIAISIITWRAWRTTRDKRGVLPLALIVAILAFNMVHTGLQKPVWLFLALALGAYAGVQERRRPAHAAVFDSSLQRIRPGLSYRSLSRMLLLRQIT